MQIRNTRETYGLIAIVLHWVVAVGFLASYVSVYYRQWFTEAKTPENWTALQLHLSVGVTIAVFVLLRVIWKARNVTLVDAPGTPLEHRAAHSEVTDGGLAGPRPSLATTSAVGCLVGVSAGRFARQFVTRADNADLGDSTNAAMEFSCVNRGCFAA